VIYLLTLNGKEHRAEIETVRPGRYRIKLDGATVVVSARRPETGIYSLLVGAAGADEFSGGKVIEADVMIAGDDVTVGVRGEQFAVTAIDERRKNLRTAAHAGGASDGAIRSPMPGKVVKILVAKGAKVTRGQGVAVVEAMKMENELSAPRDGVVKEIAVTEGQAVEGGALLLTLE
jgi:biotin carboxyl carrier protein